ncbi:hypothetical protein LCGC14_0436760 [marine sediment metagenome]|uniref:Uncharacterized protein n=1 Tax=marine sediment metagenome TaxID=412755 RepID=A0A0F9T4S9_9ZZZZ
MDFPQVEFLQALLGDSSKWRLIDASGVVVSITDGDSFTDIVTTATAGTVYLTKPIEDFTGGSINHAADLFTTDLLAQLITATSTLDQILVGTSDNADPTAGGALFDVAGFRFATSTTKTIRVQTDSSSATGVTITADRALYTPSFQLGRSERAATMYAYQGNSFVNERGQVSLPRSYAPTHLVVRITNGAASAQTIRVGVGVHVPQSIKALAISAPVATDDRGRVWFYPDDDGTLEEVDIRGCWSSLDELPMVNRRTSRSYAGRRASAILGGNFQVRAVYEMFNDDDVLTGLFAAQNQLYRGRTIALCANASKAWAGYAIQPPRRGDTTVRIAGTGDTFAGSGSLSVGDFVVIQTVDEDPITELVKVTSVSNQRSFGVAAGVKHTFPRNVPILVRQRYYWPALWLDERQSSNELLTTDHGLNYTFDALLTEDLGALQRLVDLGGSGLMTGISPSPSSRTFTTGTKSASLTRFRFR